jgi:hypothetical protein
MPAAGVSESSRSTDTKTLTDSDRPRSDMPISLRDAPMPRLTANSAAAKAIER